MKFRLSVLKASKKTEVIADALPPLEKLNGFYILGDWSNRGTPDYLVENDVITAL